MMRRRLRRGRDAVRRPDAPVLADHACIIELEGRPIGYLQFFRWCSWPDAARELDVTRRGPYGLDVLIGEPDQIGKGIGSRAVALRPRTSRPSAGRRGCR